MIGQKTIVIDWKNISQGMSTTNFTTDGGFSIGTDPSGGTLTTINPLITPGVINFPEAPVDRSTNLTGEMLASCEDPSASAARLFVSTDSGNDGRFYESGLTGILTERGAEDTTGDYVYGKSDMIGFQGEVYVTNSTHIVRWQRPNTFTYNFFSFSDSAAPHPALTFEDNAYFGDGNELLRMATAGGTPGVILTLPANQVIVALGIDPGSGRMLISVTDQYNVNGVYNTQARVLYYDGFSNKASKVVLVDEMITAFCNVGATMYIGYGQNLGYWTGAGIEFLRRLDIGLANEQLLYKQHFTNIGDIMYLVEKRRILAFGEVVKGQGKAFWYLSQNSANMTLLTNLANNLLAYSYAPAQFFTLDTKSNGSIGSGALFHTFRYDFPRYVTFNQVVIDYILPVTTNTLIAEVAVRTELGSTVIGQINAGDQNKATFELPWPSIETRSIQIRYTPVAVAQVERITIFYNQKD